MADVGKVLRDEMARLAKREIRAQTQPLTKQVRDLRRTVRDQRRRIEKLESEIARKQDRVGDGRIVAEVYEEDLDIRISPASIRRHRERLGISQREVALLLDVSTLTVSNWETGKTAPRGQNRVGIAEMRRLGVREAQERLEKIEE